MGNALGDGLPLELAEGKEHVEHEHSHRGAGVEALRGGDEVDLVLFEDLPKLVEVGQVAGNAVELVGDDDIDIAGADFPQKGLHSGAFEVLAGESGVVDEVGGGSSLVLVDGDGVLADIALGFEGIVFPPRLVVGGNAGVDGAPDKGAVPRSVRLVHGVGDHGGGLSG